MSSHRSGYYEAYKWYAPKDILNCWIIPSLNLCREKYLETKDEKYLHEIVQLLPESYNLKLTVMLNYGLLMDIYNDRDQFVLLEWVGKDGFIEWIAGLPYFYLTNNQFLSKAKEN